MNHGAHIFATMSLGVEQPKLEELINKVRESASNKLDKEILFYLTLSSLKGISDIRELVTKVDGLHVVHEPLGFSQERHRLLFNSLLANAESVTIFDSDGQYDAETIVNVTLELLRGSYDAVIPQTDRHLPGHPLRLIEERFEDWLVCKQVYCDENLSLQPGLYVLSAPAIKYLLNSSDWHLTSYIWDLEMCYKILQRKTFDISFPSVTALAQEETHFKLEDSEKKLVLLAEILNIQGSRMLELFDRFMEKYAGNFSKMEKKLLRNFIISTFCDRGVKDEKKT